MTAALEGGTFIQIPLFFCSFHCCNESANLQIKNKWRAKRWEKEIKGRKQKAIAIKGDSSLFRIHKLINCKRKEHEGVLGGGGGGGGRRWCCVVVI